MTVSTTTARLSFSGDGTNAALTISFPFIDAADLLVTRRVLATGAETVMVLTTDYTVTGGSFATGTVTVVDGATDFPGGSTVDWIITRNTPQSQLTDYVENANFGAESHEQALDKVTYLAIDRQELIDRTLKVPVTDADPGELPNTVDRASAYLAFDAAGDPVAAAAPTDTSITTTFIRTLLDDDSALTARATLAIMTTEGDVTYQSSTDAARLAIGTAGQSLRVNSGATAPSWVTPSYAAGPASSSVLPLPRNYLAGVQLTRTDANTITIAVGQARNTGDDTNLIRTATLAKDIDTTWAAGAGGGLNATDFASGISDAEVNTWYHVFLIENGSGTVDAGFDKSVVAANLLTDSGYTKYRRIGAVLTDGSRDILDFTQIGDRFLWAVPVLDVTATAADVTSATTLTVSEVPLGVTSVALIRFLIDAQTVDQGAVLAPMAETSATPSESGAPLVTLQASVSDVSTAAELSIDVNASQQIQLIQLTDTSIDYHIVTRGYVDRRGRDD